MFLKCRERRIDGKTHRSWSIVESRRYAQNKVAHRHALYLGEINDSERQAWERTIAVIDERDGTQRHLALFPTDRTPPPASEVDSMQVRMSALRLENPRQWGACWLADRLWRTLHLDDFFGARLPVNHEETDWAKVLRILVIYRLLSPGSEWRLHRHWFSTTALGDLLGVDARAAQDDTLYRCHDLLLPLKEELFGHLQLLFVGHPDAGWRTAVPYFIVGTCKLQGVNEGDYLTCALSPSTRRRHQSHRPPVHPSQRFAQLAL